MASAMTAILTVHEQSDQEKGHEGTLGVVHVEAIAKPLFGLSANNAFHALLVAFWDEVLGEVLAEVFCQSTGLGNDKGLLQSRGFDCDHRRLAFMSIPYVDDR